ncbi:TPA: aspartate/glutamate racemase family protein [Photobacterium damselae]
MGSTRIGVIGGMGNEAMVDLIEKINGSISASDSIELVAFGNSRLAYKAEEVGQQWQATDTPELRKYATATYTLRLMQYLDVKVMGLACNSAHELFRTILPQIPVHFVDMIKQTAASLEGSEDTILVMGVNSLVDSGLYQSALADQGVQSTKPSPENQQKVMDAIYHPEFGIKTAKITPQAEQLLCEVICDELAKQGCTKIVLGCTELPLALTAESCLRFKQQGLLPPEITVIDASMVLAQSLISTLGDASSLIEPLQSYQQPYLDWIAPLAVSVSSLEQLASIQKQIFAQTTSYLAKNNKSLTGSYMHLPTLFFTDNAKGVADKLRAIDIEVIDGDDLTAADIEQALQRHLAE